MHAAEIQAGMMTKVMMYHQWYIYRLHTFSRVSNTSHCQQKNEAKGKGSFDRDRKP